MSNKPSMLSGHIFSAFIACPQRAWLDLHGNRKNRLFSPVYLRGLQREGLRHEREVEEHYFPKAVRLDDQLQIDEKVEQTEKLLLKGTEVILQGAIRGADGVGIVDVLERVGSSGTSQFGSVYRVGEIKNVDSLQSGHIFQAMWYRDLLLELTGSSTLDVFFITRNLTRKNLVADAYRIAYKRTLKELRDLKGDAQPGEHLSPQCPTCTWRGICMPELSHRKDLSLLPRLGRSQCRLLREEGFSSYDQVARNIESACDRLGCDSYDYECISTAVSRFKGRHAVTRDLLDWDWISGLEPVAVDIKLNADGMPGPGVTPDVLIADFCGTLDVAKVGDEGLLSLFDRENLAVYGEADLAGLKNLAEKRGIRFKREPYVLLRLVRAHVHEPMLGYELSCVEAHVCGRPEPEERLMEPQERILALRRVRDWIAGRS